MNCNMDFEEYIDRFFSDYLDDENLVDMLFSFLELIPKLPAHRLLAKFDGAIGTPVISG